VLGIGDAALIVRGGDERSFELLVALGACVRSLALEWMMHPPCGRPRVPSPFRHRIRRAYAVHPCRGTWGLRNSASNSLQNVRSCSTR